MSSKTALKSASYLLRLTPETKERWHQMADFYRLPLSKFIEKRVESHPLTLPKVPAINAQTSVKLGQFDIQLRRISQQFHHTLSAFIKGYKEKQIIATTEFKDLIQLIRETKTLLEEVRLELRAIRLQLSGVNSSEEEEKINPSTFQAEDWD